MAQVKRANVFLDIPDEDIEKYMAKGFSVVDEFGNVIRQSVPNDLTQLKSAYTEHMKIIEELKAENRALQRDIDLLKTQATGAGKTAPEEPVSEVKTTRRKKN